MNSLLLSTALLLAEDPPPAAGGGLQGLISFAPMVLIFVGFWFLILRPMNRERSRQQSLVAAVKKNDKVITTSGIMGVVTNVSKETNEVTIRVDDNNNTRLRMTLSSIASVLGDDVSAEPPAK